MGQLYIICLPVKSQEVVGMESLDIDGESSDDSNIYSRNVRELLLEDDEISPLEEGFLNGYDGAV